MAQQSSTLSTGSRVPEFTLAAASGGQTVSLAELLQHGPLVIEFLRGTW